MLKNKVIKPFTSPYIFNIVIVEKKDRVGEGIDKMYINFILLNEVTEKDSRSIFIIKKYLLLFYKVKQLIILNLTLAYWQILLTK